MPLYVCNCTYSSSDKSNFNKHIVKCVKYIKPIPEVKNEIEIKQYYEQQLLIKQQQFDEQLAEKHNLPLIDENGNRIK